MKDDSVIELTNVTKTFGTTKAVNAISLRLLPGEVYGFLGPNGAGKTTTIRMIMDFIRPTQGEISLFGKNNKNGMSYALSNTGFLSADNALYANWTAIQHIECAENLKGGSSDAHKLAKQFGLKLNAQYRHLSSGNKQKLALILALMHRPKLLVLDEPTRGLDPLLQQELYDILHDFKKSGGSIFMSSHNLSEVQKVCDRIGIIRGGKMVASETIDSLRKRSTHEVTVQFAKPFNISEFGAKNIEIKHSTDTHLVAHIQGDLNPFLSKISRHQVSDIEINHVSLEEMFMRFYQ